jgi:putative tricarboxylic transport membrane protein
LILQKLSKQGKGELAFAGFLTLLGVFVAWDTSRMDVPQGGSIISPQTFPYMVAGFLTLVSIALTLQVLRGNYGTPDGTEPDDEFQSADFTTMAIFAAAIAIHVVLLEKAGYVIAATISFWGVAFAFGSRKFFKDFIFSLIFAVLVYVIFSLGLNINLPTGIFDGITGK